MTAFPSNWLRAIVVVVVVAAAAAATATVALFDVRRHLTSIDEILSVIVGFGWFPDEDGRFGKKNKQIGDRQQQQHRYEMNWPKLMTD